MTLWMDAGFLGALTVPSEGYADPDVNAYIAAVETADFLSLGHSAPLPTAIKDAINTLITGLKGDSQWANINTLVMVNAAQTIAGTQIAMKGTNTASYTNVVSADYARGLGILGSGTKRGDTGVLSTAFTTNASGFVIGLCADYTNQSAAASIIGSPETNNRTVAGYSSTNIPSGKIWTASQATGSGAAASSSMTAVAIGRESTTQTRMQSWANGTIESNTLVAVGSGSTPAGNVFLLARTDLGADRWNRRLTGYVLGTTTATSATLAAIVPRITTYANAVRTHLGV